MGCQCVWISCGQLWFDSQLHIWNERLNAYCCVNFSSQPVPHNWFIKGSGMYYLVYMIIHVKLPSHDSKRAGHFVPVADRDQSYYIIFSHWIIWDKYTNSYTEGLPMCRGLWLLDHLPNLKHQLTNQLPVWEGYITLPKLLSTSHNIFPVYTKPG